jgi:hypothetical protein
MTSLTEVMSEQLASDLQSKESGPESGIRRQKPADIVTDEEVMAILLEDEIGMYQ